MFADTSAPEQRAAWIALLDEMIALEPALVVPGHRHPGTAADASTIASTRTCLQWFEVELERATDGSGLTAALLAAYPDHGMTVAAQIRANVVTGEMTWG